MPASSSPTRALLRAPAVEARIGLRKSWIYAAVAAGRFPAPVKIGRVSAWDSAAIDAWIAERAAPPMN